MESYKLETMMTSNGQLTLKDLPFKDGESIEIIILALHRAESSKNPYPLRDSVLKYDAPMEPVVDQDWEAAQ